jgi:general secretion pathway protein A
MTPRLRPEEFLQAILDDLAVIFPLSGNKNDMIKEFRDFLLEHAGQGRRVAIVVDEAQQLPDDTLEELRLLSNLETEKEKLLQIVLVGQPELADKLVTDQFRQLNQRIAVRASLTHLSPQATADYLATRVHRAGARVATLFEAAASEEIYKSSGGVPRLINLIASRSLMVGYLEGKPIVQARQAAIAASEVMQQERRQRSKGKTDRVRRWWLAGGAVLALLMMLLILFGRG